jgi:hypothetical protein
LSIDEAKVGELMAALAGIGDEKKQNAALMPELCGLVEHYQEFLPHALKKYAGLASVYWGRGVGSDKELEDARLICWKFLEEKGSSAQIVDVEDAAVRALICVLYGELANADFVDDMTYWFFSVLERIRKDDLYVDEKVDYLIVAWGGGKQGRKAQ